MHKVMNNLWHNQFRGGLSLSTALGEKAEIVTGQNVTRIEAEFVATHTVFFKQWQIVFVFKSLNLNEIK